jgi:hypothetical protein
MVYMSRRLFWPMFKEAWEIAFTPKKAHCLSGMLVHGRIWDAAEYGRCCGGEADAFCLAFYDSEALTA